MHSREKRNVEAVVQSRSRCSASEIRDSTILNHRHGSLESLGSLGSVESVSLGFRRVYRDKPRDDIWRCKDRLAVVRRRAIKRRTCRGELSRERMINPVIRWLDQRYDEEENNDDITSALFLRFIIVSSFAAAGCVLRSLEFVNSHRAFRSRGRRQNSSSIRAIARSAATLQFTSSLSGI